MSDFDTRPKGTVMYGAFDAFAQAERALRVLKNAGYARASFELGENEEGSSAEPPVVVVDAAAAGATRAAEILEEHGAQIRFVSAPAPVASAHVEPEPERELEPEAVRITVSEPTLVVAPVERKPRVRRRAPSAAQRAAGPPSIAPNDKDVVIVTRTIDSVVSDGS